MYGERPLTRCFGGVVFVIDGYTRGRVAKSVGYTAVTAVRTRF